jgi:hypothetical protein
MQTRHRERGTEREPARARRSDVAPARFNAMLAGTESRDGSRGREEAVDAERSAE